MNEHTFRPAPVLTNMTIVGLGIFALLDSMYIPGGLAGMYGAGVFTDGVRNQEYIDLSMLVRGLSALGQLVLFVYMSIVFCMLMYRCAVNARAIGFSGFGHTPGMLVGWFFIPFAHLIMPYKAIREIWQSSNVEASEIEKNDWWSAPVGKLLPFWWAAWIFGTIMNNLGSRMSRSPTESVQTVGMCVIPFSATLQVLSAILCIVVVVRLTKKQLKQARELYDLASEHPNQYEESYV